MSGTNRKPKIEKTAFCKCFAIKVSVSAQPLMSYACFLLGGKKGIKRRTIFNKKRRIIYADLSTTRKFD